MKTLVFDMDGTIANLYGVANWLEDLCNENTRPYVEAEPIYNMTILTRLLNTLKGYGYTIVVTTWLAKNGTKTYNNEVRKAKVDWLNRYNFPVDEIHMVKYGTTKANCTRKREGEQILFDDNEKVRKGWTLGETVNAEYNILDKLYELILRENAQ